jgi:hypothetical protein
MRFFINSLFSEQWPKAMGLALWLSPVQIGTTIGIRKPPTAWFRYNISTVVCNSDSRAALDKLVYIIQHQIPCAGPKTEVRTGV